jgi:mono/diheme cytochrome c family protein
MLSGFKVKGTLRTEFPRIFPSKKLSEGHSVVKGFHLFVQNCFACHTLNKNGTSHMGPDLNLPMNPTEYLKRSALKKLIRNPQNVRHWPQGKMLGFDKNELSDREIDLIIQYLKHMSRLRH